MVWYGHVTRSEGLAKTILQGTVLVRGGEEARKTEEEMGRQCKRMGRLEFTASQRAAAAEDRGRWRELVAESALVPNDPPRVTG